MPMDDIGHLFAFGRQEVIDSLKTFRTGREGGLGCFSEGKEMTRLCMSNR